MEGKEQIVEWAQKWEKAQNEEIFKKEDQVIPSKHVVNETFFGNRENQPTNEVSSVDAKYWDTVYKYSQLFGEQSCDPLHMTEELKKVSPNPTSASSIGPDAALTPEAIGSTYTPEDLEDLAEMKQQLYALEAKLGEMEGRGENSGKFSTKIEKLKAKIDEMSDLITYEFRLDQNK